MVVIGNRLPWWLSGQESTCQFRRYRFGAWIGKFPWRRKWQPTPVFLPGKPHGQRSLLGYSPWGGKESDMTEQLNSTINDRVSPIPQFNVSPSHYLNCLKLVIEFLTFTKILKLSPSFPCNLSLFLQVLLLTWLLLLLHSLLLNLPLQICVFQAPIPGLLFSLNTYTNTT